MTESRQPVWATDAHWTILNAVACRHTQSASLEAVPPKCWERNNALERAQRAGNPQSKSAAPLRQVPDYAGLLGIFVGLGLGLSACGRLGFESIGLTAAGCDANCAEHDPTSPQQMNVEDVSPLTQATIGATPASDAAAPEPNLATDNGQQNGVTGSTGTADGSAPSMLTSAGGSTSGLSEPPASLDASAPSGAYADAGTAGPCVASPEVCDGIDNDCNGLVDDTPTLTALCASDEVCKSGVCEPLPSALNCTAYQLGSHAYAWCQSAEDWPTAQTQCETLGGYLATASSSEEDTALKGLLAKQDDAWIGLHRTSPDCQWEWVNGEAVSYTAWPVNYPDGVCGTYDCTQLWGQREGQWDDTYCTDKQPFLCEWD